MIHLALWLASVLFLLCVSLVAFYLGVGLLTAFLRWMRSLDWGKIVVVFIIAWFLLALAGIAGVVG